MRFKWNITSLQSVHSGGPNKSMSVDESNSKIGVECSLEKTRSPFISLDIRKIFHNLRTIDQTVYKICYLLDNLKLKWLSYQKTNMKMRVTVSNKNEIAQKVNTRENKGRSKGFFVDT